MGASLMAKLKKAYRTQYRYTLTPLALESMRHLLEALYYGLNKSAPPLAIDSG
jgi:hypothetical protein